MRRVPWFVLVPALLGSPVTPAAVFTVGSDGACTHTSVLAAVSAAAGNGAGLDEIRVATNQTYANVIAPVASHSVTVRGGYSSCSDTTPSGRTVIRGGTAGVNGTFTTSGTAASYQLNLENLELREGSNATRRGGALRVEGDFVVTLRNTEVTDNFAARGGGIYIDGSAEAELVIDAASVVSNNIASVSGGGIYCQSNGSVTLEGLVLANTAQDAGSDPNESGNGGGIALYDCFMNHEESPGFRGVLANTALRHGGGYYLRNGSQLFITGNADDPGKLTDNVASETGGGIAINDDLGAPGSQFDAFNSWIERNRAPTGAGVGLIAGGVGTIARTLAGAACHDATYCSTLSLNDLPVGTSSGVGCAAMVGPRGVLRVRRTRVEDNCFEGGMAFRQRADSQLRFDSSVIADNGDAKPFSFDLQFTGLLEVAWSTVTGHFPSGQIGFLTVPNDNSSGTARIYGSLLGEPFQQMVSVGGIGGPPPMTFEFDCLVVDSFYSQSLTAIRGVALAPPYGMIAPAGGNFRLASGSALPVDWCDDSLAPRIGGDADGVTALYDAPRANQYGINDPGAYEFVVVALPDFLFANGFE